MFMFWSIVWAFVILSFFNGIINWRIPEELQIPSFLIKNIGGLPSFYTYRLELSTELENLNEWLQQFVDEQLKNLPSIDFKANQDVIPKCSLTKSSKTSCITSNPNNCNRFDERCVQYWQTKKGRRTLQCFELDNKPLNCNSNGYYVQKIYHNNDQLLLVMSNSKDQVLRQQIEPIQDCYTYFVKQDNRTFISFPIPEMQKTSQTQEVHLRPNVRKSVFYLSDQYNQNLTLLWTLTEAHLNSTHICSCKACYELNINLHNEMESNKTVGGLKAQLLSEGNKTTVNLTTNWQDEQNPVGELELNMKREIVDRTTPLFWRRPGRFDCPSEITCPLELFYIFQVQSGLVASDYFLEICFLIAACIYQRKSKKYF